MSKINVGDDQLRRWKKAPLETHFIWLESALDFCRELDKRHAKLRSKNNRNK